MSPRFCESFRALLVLAACSFPAVAQALTLTGLGTATTLTGSLGTVDVVSLNDTLAIDGYLTSGGLVSPAPSIPIKRVQYDVLNQAGNGSIFEFRVDFPVGTTVIGAANPGRFRWADGTLETYWTGSGFATLFDSGFGLYAYDVPNGAEWRIRYAPDHVLWEHLGNGFFPDTATGRTDVGSALPTFALFFDPSTPLGLQPAEVRGHLVSGAPVSASGLALSAVPEPHAAVLLVLATLSLGWARWR